MMYSNFLVAVIKHNDQILRENGNVVAMPFGEEFSILIKNLNNRRAKVRVFIDGSDALDGTELVIDAKNQIDLKRFIKKGNMNAGNAFKFIERTESVENHRGINAEDGLVRVEFVYEVDYGTFRQHALSVLRSVGGSSLASGSIYPQGSLSSTYSSVAVNTAGITAPGSVNNQKFTTTYWAGDDSTTKGTIILQMVGKVGTTTVSEAVTVKAKPKCTSCGKMNKATAKFCTNCGTGLTLI